MRRRSFLGALLAAPIVPAISKLTKAEVAPLYSDKLTVRPGDNSVPVFAIEQVDGKIRIVLRGEMIAAQEALQEAFESCPSDRQYDVVEIRHPSFDVNP